MKNMSYDVKQYECCGDMAAWERMTAPDNAGELHRLRRGLKLARREELTARQRQMLQMRFEENKSVTEIARELGVNKSTVSRTLHRAKCRLYRCLRYTL